MSDCRPLGVIPVDSLYADLYRREQTQAPPDSALTPQQSTCLQWESAAAAQLLTALTTQPMVFTTGSDVWLQQYTIQTMLLETQRDVIVVDMAGCTLPDLGRRVRQAVANAIAEASIECGQPAWLLLQNADHLLASLTPQEDGSPCSWLASVFCTDFDLRIVIPSTLTTPHAISISFLMLRPAHYIAQRVQTWLRESRATMAQRMSVNVDLKHVERGIEQAAAQLLCLLQDLLSPLLNRLGSKAATLAGLHCLAQCIHGSIHVMIASNHLNLTSTDEALALPIMRSVVLGTFHWAHACSSNMTTAQLTLLIDELVQATAAFRGQGVGSLVSSEGNATVDLVNVLLAAGSGTLRCADATGASKSASALPLQHHVYAQMHACLLAAGHSIIVAGETLLLT